MKIRCCFFLLSLATCTIVSAAKFDVDKFAVNGELDRAALVKMFLQGEDTNIDFSAIKNCPIDSFVSAKLLQHVGYELATYKLAGGPYTVDEVKIALKQKPEALGPPAIVKGQKTPSGFEGFALRDKWQNIGAASTGDASIPDANPTKSNPATFSFARNYLKGESDWSVHAAIFDAYDFYSWRGVPSVTWDKISSSTNNVDSLVFRLSGAGNLSDSIAARGGWLFATDSKISSKQTGGELEFEYVNTKWGIGSFHSIPCVPLVYMTRIYVHNEDGYVIAAGKNKNLTQNSIFSRIGPSAEIDFKPWVDPSGSLAQFVNKFIISETVDDYEAVSTDTKSTRLFITSGAYNFNKNVSLKCSYSFGRQPLSAQREQEFDLSFGLMF